MGCGVFRPIEMAMQMIDRKVYTFSDDKYGYKNIPKLFVLDLSSNVEEAWRRLKNLVCNTDNLDDFKTKLQDDSFYEGINTKGDCDNLFDRLDDFSPQWTILSCSSELSKRQRLSEQIGEKRKQ